MAATHGRKQQQAAQTDQAMQIHGKPFPYKGRALDPISSLPLGNARVEISRLLVSTGLRGKLYGIYLFF
jgi:hypothetical protein